MGVLMLLWRKLTHTKALDESSGQLETKFFESFYRVIYLTGLSTTDRHLLYILYSYTVKMFAAMIVCGEIWFCSTVELSMDELVSCLNVMILQSLTIYRYQNMVENKDIYQHLATSMESPHFDTSTEKRKQLVEYWAARNENYLKLLLVLGFATLSAWYIFPLIDDVDYNLMVNIRLPYDYSSPLSYTLTYTLTSVMLTYVALFVMVTDLKMQAHLIHILCQFTVLADCFENLIEDCQSGFEGIDMNELLHDTKFKKKFTTRLGDLVKQHKLILANTMNLQGTLSRPMLGQLSASGALICFIGYQAATTITDSFVKGLMSFLFLGYNAFELFIICKWCEEITVESQRIGEAMYFSSWASGVVMLPGVRSTILLIIARAYKPLVFTAGGMYDLSLTSFATLVKTSYSALTVMLRFRNE